MAYTLDEIDNRIIYELDANCRIPETRLAKMVGKSKESVRYRIRRLKEEGVISGFTAYADMTKVGFEAYKLYLYTREKPKLMDSFISHVRARPDVFWLGKGDGAWNVGLTFFAKNSAEFFREKNELFSKYRELVIEESVVVVVEVFSFGKKFLIPVDAPRVAYKLFGLRERNAIEAKNSEILHCLTQDGRMSYAAIASKLKIPADMVRARVKDMERKKIIVQYATVLNYEKLGYEYYKTFLHFEGLVKKEEKHLFEIALKHQNIMSYLKVLAPWDIELEIMVENYRGYNKIINYLREQFPDTLVKVETTVQSVDEVFPSRKVPEGTTP